MANISDYCSKKIQALSFVASYMVVLIHANPGLPLHRGWGGVYQIIVQDGICGFAVPFFFIVTGYFFMNRYDASFLWWNAAIRKRVRSLMIPYFLWCCLAIIIGRMTSSVWPDWTEAFGITTITPANPPLWYIKLVFVMGIVSPILIWILNNVTTRKWLLLLLGIAILLLLSMDILLIKTVGRSVLYFGLGIGIARGLFGKQFDINWISKILIVCWIGAVLGELILLKRYRLYWNKAWLYMPLISAPLIWFGYDVLYNRIRFLRSMVSNARFLDVCKTSFFIYCSHAVLMMIAWSWYKPDSVCNVFVFGTCVFVICLVCAMMIRRASSRCYSLLVGGRL